jgi:DNA-3-methyladenine glycosylase I
MLPPMTLERCAWATSDPLYLEYHDREWGVPAHDDRVLFEFLVLEGAQAGLSWLTILRKRENYRRAYDGFDPRKVAAFGPRKVAALLADQGIVRNRLKIVSSIDNARALLRIQEESGSFDRWIWSFVGGRAKRNHWATLRDVPSSSPESDAMSAALRARGFRFVGTTICYSFMQACGLVFDHTRNCFLARGAQPRRGNARARPRSLPLK